MSTLDPLTSIALVGTARSSSTTGTTVDALHTAIAEGLSDLPAERHLLLRAGVRAAQRMAASTRGAPPPALEPAPADLTPACSERAAQLLAEMFRGTHAELLPEALGMLARAGRRLPHAVLPDALAVRDPAIAGLLGDVIGERGRWLAHHTPRFASHAAAATAASLEELERTFLDGAPAARRAALGAARLREPARARQWLEATWATEKADHRASFLAELAAGLSDADEPFLEAALKDRSSGVRDVAQALLPKILASAFLRRMTARAEGMLARSDAGALEITPPQSVDAAAERDGLLAKPPPGVGPRAYWLMRAMAAVPPAHWEERLRATADEIVAGAAESEWAPALFDGLTSAAVAHGATQWAAPLARFWETCDAKLVAQAAATEKLVALLQLLPPDAAAARVVSLLERRAPRLPLPAALAVLATPWPLAVGRAFVAAAARDLAAANERALEIVHCLALASRALPTACVADALAALDPQKVLETHEPWWSKHLTDFVDVLGIRHAFVQEIAP